MNEKGKNRSWIIIVIVLLSLAIVSLSVYFAWTKIRESREANAVSEREDDDDDGGAFGLFDREEEIELDVVIDEAATYNDMKHHEYYDIEISDALEKDLDELIAVFETEDPDQVFRKLRCNPEDQDLLNDIFEELSEVMTQKKGFNFVYDGYKMAFRFPPKTEKFSWYVYVAIIPESGRGYFYESIFDYKYENYRVGVAFCDCNDYMFNGEYSEKRFEEAYDRSFTYTETFTGSVVDGFAHDNTVCLDEGGTVTTFVFEYGDCLKYGIQFREDEEPTWTEDSLPTLYSFGRTITISDGKYGHRDILFY